MKRADCKGTVWVSEIVDGRVLTREHGLVGETEFFWRVYRNPLPIKGYSTRSVPKPISGSASLYKVVDIYSKFCTSFIVVSESKDRSRERFLQQLLLVMSFHQESGDEIQQLLLGELL